MRNCRRWTGTKGLVLVLLALNVGLSQGQGAACPAFPRESMEAWRASCSALEAGQGCTEGSVFSLSQTDLIDLIDSEVSDPLALLSLEAGLNEDRALDVLLYGGVSLQAVPS